MRISFCALAASLLLAAPFSICVECRADDENEVLLEATSPFEDMAEFALDKQDLGMAKSLAAADGQAAAVKKALPEAAAKQFDAFLKTLHESADKKNYHAVAMNAVETFRLLIDNLDADDLEVPKDVLLLDYAGFKLHVLGAATKPDWVAMSKTVDEAANWWKAVRSKVADKALRDAFDSTVKGLQKAAVIKDLPMLEFAAQMDLDLVDLIEGQFEGKEKAKE